MLIGYARVSTEKQNLEMQITSLKKAGCEKIFSEKVTGTRTDRPEYLKMKEFVRDGKDTIVVYKLDRLGRSLKHLISEVQEGVLTQLCHANFSTLPIFLSIYPYFLM
jgi:DNA invertase Pin-like site-specific DNA recombinase